MIVASSSPPPGALRRVRPLLLGALLAGMVLTIVTAPSALRAQQSPPSQAPGGYGVLAEPAPKDLALAARSGGGGGNLWLWLCLAALALGVAALVGYFLRRRAGVTPAR